MNRFKISFVVKTLALALSLPLAASASAQATFKGFMTMKLTATKIETKAPNAGGPTPKGGKEEQTIDFSLRIGLDDEHFILDNLSLVGDKLEDLPTAYLNAAKLDYNRKSGALQVGVKNPKTEEKQGLSINLQYAI